MAVEDLSGPFHRVLRHPVIDHHGRLDHAGVEPVLPGLPAEVVGIQGNAVSPQAGAGIEGLEAIRLGLGRVYHFPDVDVHFIAQNSQLIDQAYVDVPIGVLQDLLHLRHGGRGYGGHVPIQNGAVHHGDHLRGVSTDGTHNLRGVAGLIDEVTRIHPLRGEAQVKVLPALEAAALFQNGADQLLRGAGIGGGLQYHHGTGLEVFGDGNGGIPDVADIRLLVLVQRCRHTDGNEIYFTDFGEIRSSLQHPGGDQLLQVRIHHVADVVFPGVHHIHLFLLDVKANGAEAVFRLIHRQRQTHIPQAAHAHGQGFVLNFGDQFFLDAHKAICSFILTGHLRPVPVGCNLPLLSARFLD